MLHDWGVIAAAFGYIGFLFFRRQLRATASRRRSAARASALIYPLSLAIYCTSWTFFGSVGFATRTSFDFSRDLCRPDPDDRALHAAAAARHQAGEIAEHHLDRRFHRRALRQEPGGRRHRGTDRDHRLGSLHRAAAQGGGIVVETILSEDQAFASIPIIGDIALVVTLAMAVFAGAVRNPARPTPPSISMA